MKLVILAGGKGTRLSEYTKVVPKPMVTIKKNQLFFILLNTFTNMELKRL